MKNTLISVQNIGKTSIKQILALFGLKCGLSFGYKNVKILLFLFKPGKKNLN
jgi:hypothetical protein